MSADNWTICPKCKKLVEEKQRKLEEKVVKSYGQIPAEEYMLLLEKSKQPLKIESSLREDYDIGIDEDDFSVNYRSGCRVCGFSFNYKYAQKVS